MSLERARCARLQRGQAQFLRLLPTIIYHNCFEGLVQQLHWRPREQVFFDSTWSVKSSLKHPTNFSIGSQSRMHASGLESFLALVTNVRLRNKSPLLSFTLKRLSLLQTWSKWTINPQPCTWLVDNCWLCPSWTRSKSLHHEWLVQLIQLLSVGLPNSLGSPLFWHRLWHLQLQGCPLYKPRNILVCWFFMSEWRCAAREGAQHRYKDSSGHPSSISMTRYTSRSFEKRY